jgi:CheY-like chemotaxis protein/signal transduction histidine kinase
MKFELNNATSPRFLESLKTGFLSSLTEILSNLKNIHNTNEFMLMNIHRVIDFTKASNGLKLVPKLESTDLKETLDLPLHCMSNIQNRIQIELLPYDSNLICSHVITDKQWLQENILCLLSNAVKYSSQGKVTVSVQLVNAPMIIKSSPSDLFANLQKNPTLNDLFAEKSVLEEKRDTILSSIPSMNAEKSFFKSSWCKTLSATAIIPRGIHRSKNVRIIPVLASPHSLSTSQTMRTELSRETGSDCSNSLNNLFTKERRSSEENLQMNDLNLPKSHLLFEIADQGIGMSEESMKKLFNPFQQTQKLAGGTGLGLYSLSKRIEALRGQYGVKKREDGLQGSVFWFSIPYRPDYVMKDYLRKSIQLGATFNAALLTQTESLNILLAEDSPSISKMTTALLKRMGHSVSVAENGEVALKRLIEVYENSVSSSKGSNRRKFDVVLMDLQMPVMDGLEATRRLREYEQKHYEKTGQEVHQMIIGVTATTDEDTFQIGLSSGIDDFLPKPFIPTQFNHLVFKN